MSRTVPNPVDMESTAKLAALPLHPYLFACYLPAWALSQNADLFSFSEAQRAFALFFFSAGAAHGAAWLTYRDRYRAGLAASIWIVFGLLVYRPTVSAVRDLLPPPAAIAATAAVGLVALVVGSLLVRRITLSTVRLNIVLNATGATLLFLPLCALAAAHLKTAAPGMLSPARLPPSGTVSATKPIVAPDIYHIVLDGYVRSDVMVDLFGFDNSAFLEGLRRFGFFVANRATANYSQTLLSISSMLSMYYVHGSDIENSTERENYSKMDAKRFRMYLSAMIENSSVRSILEAHGYHSVAIDTVYVPVLINSADEIIVSDVRRSLCLFNTFEELVFRYTPLTAICNHLTGGENLNTYVRSTVRFALDQRVYEHVSKPVFIFQHVLSPHPPFVFASDGSPAAPPDQDGFADGSYRIRNDPKRRAYYRQSYIQQVQYLNNKILDQVAHVLKTRERPLVIIIHSDHGSGLYLDHESRAGTCLRERFAPLLAVYSSDGMLQSKLNHNVSLVNLYRIILNVYFGTNLPVLKDLHFFARWDDPMNVEPISVSDLDRSCSVP